jgi:hypothetical protein
MFSKNNQERVDINGLRHALNEIINSKHLHDDKMKSILFFFVNLVHKFPCSQIMAFTLISISF